jgi:hypothetical protein
MWATAGQIRHCDILFTSVHSARASVVLCA